MTKKHKEVPIHRPSKPAANPRIPSKDPKPSVEKGLGTSTRPKK
jgi:hypothetical protein